MHVGGWPRGAGAGKIVVAVVIDEIRLGVEVVIPLPVAQLTFLPAFLRRLLRASLLRLLCSLLRRGRRWRCIRLACASTAGRAGIRGQRRVYSSLSPINSAIRPDLALSPLNSAIRRK